jgi:hypothetical protein
MDLRDGVKISSKVSKRIVRQASPLVDACEGSPYAMFSAGMMYFSSDPRVIM